MAGTTLGTAYVQIVPSAQGIKGSISNVLGGEAESAGTSIGSKFAAFAKKAITAAAIGTVIKSALSEGAKLQQSYFGGLDTLYGEAADKAREYARAASEAGISMNSWSEQAVSFGAVLKRTFGEDAAGAADAANRAILAMADNSAKMGTDISSIQMAYQGFAKENYTMLDNLKLGYGGTKTEMERLIADAASMTDIQKELGVAVDANDMSFNNVANAIQVVQQSLGIAGVAAEEASQTFSGSFNAMKAAAQNFLGSLAIGEGVSEALSTLMTSASTFFFGNFLPMIGTLIASLPGAIATFLQQGLPMLVANVTALLTSLTASISNVANGLTSSTVTAWVTANIPKILAAGGQLIGKLASAFITNLPKIVAAIARIGLAIVTGLGSAIWGKVSAAAAGVRDRFMEPINQMKDKVKGILDKIKNFFPVNLGKILHFSLPKISVSGGTAPWGIGGKGTKPSFSVSWSSHALGGIISKRLLMTEGSTVHEFGEAGSEAILPLNPFWKKMDEIANNVQGGNTVNIYINGSDKDPRQIAEEVKRVLVRETNNRRLAWQ